VLNETPTLAPDGLPYRLLTLRNSAGMVVTLMDWGATLLSARVPMPMAACVKRCSAARRRNSISPGRLSGRIRGPLRQPHRQKPF
jgi:galactose mutarotase-like enzyme